MASRLAGASQHARVHLAAGLTLLAAVSRAMAGVGWVSANLLVLGGRMRRAVYYTSELKPAGPRWIGYGPAREPAGPPWLVMATATFGRGAAGEDALHCHAVLAGPDAVPVGGHLDPALCVVGPDGLVAHATAAEGAVFTLRRDAQTGFDLLTPA